MGFFKEIFPHYLPENNREQKTAREKDRTVNVGNNGKKADRGQGGGISRRTVLKAGLAGAAAAALGALGVKEEWGEGDREKAPDPTGGRESSLAPKSDISESRPAPWEMETLNIADHYLKAYYEIEHNVRGGGLWKEDLFTDDFFIAVELTESGFNPRAESHKGAFGVMQIMPITLKDITFYLNRLKGGGLVEFDGPAELDDKNLKELKDLSLEYPDYNRALGKVFFVRLLDGKYGYGIGSREYERGDLKSARRKICHAYNLGPTRYRKYLSGKIDKIPKETEEYPGKIEKYMERINNIRNIFADSGLDPSDNERVMLVARLLDFFPDYTRGEELEKVALRLRSGDLDNDGIRQQLAM